MKISYAPLAILCLGLGACTTPMPVETGYPLTYQQKMLSAHHWDVMAIDVANWLQNALIGPSPEPGKDQQVRAQESRPIVTLYVQKPRYDSDAGEGFYNLLTTHLVERGFIITMNPSVGLPVTYDMQVVTDRLLRPWMVGSPAGWDNMDQQVVTNWSLETVKYEVIVNVSVMNADRYLVRYSNVYYVGDKGQYIAMQPSATRMMEVVGP